MKGLEIFSHSARLVLRNWKEALQIGLLPFVIVFVAGALLLGGSMFSMAQMGGPDMMGDDVAAMAGFGVRFFLMWILAMFIILTVIVNWHRFVLLEEYPSGWVPPFRMGLALGYFGRIIMLVLLAVVAMLPVMFVATMLDAATGGSGMMVGLLTILVGIFLGIAFYRVAAILPAGAIGKPITLQEAWEATRGATGTIVTLVLVLFAANLVVQLVVAVLMVVFVPLGILAYMAATVFLGLVSVSVLTTFYGHYIEGRPIG